MFMEDKGVLVEKKSVLVSSKRIRLEAAWCTTVTNASLNQNQKSRLLKSRRLNHRIVACIFSRVRS